MGYRKKPAVIEAKRWMGDNYQEIVDFCGDVMSPHTNGRDLLIYTPEGKMTCYMFDWIIREGDVHYPCKPEVFSATYEPERQSRKFGWISSQAQRCCCC